MSQKKTNILIAGSEAWPLAKVGGLADVIGALGKRINEFSANVRVAIPKYRVVSQFIKENKISVKRTVEVSIVMEAGEEVGKIEEIVYKGLTFYLVDRPEYFDRNGIYLDNETRQDFNDNLERFVFFSKAILEGLKALDFQPDIIHAQDWQMGLLPVYLKTLYQSDSFFTKTKSVFTVHNLSYQGIFPVEIFSMTGLDWKYFTVAGLEYYGHLNLIKGGIIFSDLTTTVSETYAKEIQTPELGNGLEGVIQEKAAQGKMVGIVNGVDYSEWNPQTDAYLKKEFNLNYSLETVSNKKKIKKLFLEKIGFSKPDLSRPLIGIVSRMVDQKGFDILFECIEDILKENVYFVVLGQGKYEYESRFKELQAQHPDKIKSFIEFNVSLSHQIEAASDTFLLPSRFEPCGLTQLYSLKYGTLPIVRKTGGLADTVFDGENGFLFEPYNPDELLRTLKKAIDVYRKDQNTWKAMVQTAMTQDWSWKKAAKIYFDTYLELLDEGS